ncbi:MAG: ABC transporter substrate-binding protein [Gammaproteobacteria bacterium]|nr:ABC transporter substrate-binding protein [Gammaproteobacteria bacterium]
MKKVDMARRVLVKFVLSIFLLLSSGIVLAQADNNPQAMLKQLTAATIDQIKAYKTAHPKDVKVPFSVIYNIVDKELLPHVAKEKMLQSILARQCSYSSATQKCEPIKVAMIPKAQWQDLQQQFIYLLVNMYASALSEADKYEITFKRTRQKIVAIPGAEISIDSQVQMPQSDPISLTYQLIYQSDQWLVYDFSVNGSISIVESLRAQFAPVIQQKGIGGLIQMLKTHNENFTKRQDANS